MKAVNESNHSGFKTCIGVVALLVALASMWLLWGVT